MRKISLAVVALLFSGAVSAQSSYYCVSDYSNPGVTYADATSACKAVPALAGNPNIVNDSAHPYSGNTGTNDIYACVGHPVSSPTLASGIGTAYCHGTTPPPPPPPPPPCINPPNTPAPGPPLPGFFVGHASDVNASKPDGDVGNPFGKKQAFGQCYIMPNGAGNDKPECYSKPSATGGRNFYCHLPGHYAEGSPNPQDSQGDMAGGAPENPGACPKGSKQIGTDSTGGEICGGTGSPDTSKSSSDNTTTASNPNGSTTTTTTNITNNTDGSTTTTTTNVTTNADGSKSTTSTAATKQADGSQGKKDLPQSDFCTEHGDLNICNNSTVYGNCETISCDGDAIQCAILQQNAKNVCENEKETDFSRLAAAEFAKLPSSGIVTNVDIGQRMRLDESGFLGGGACFQDKTFAYMGQSLVVPFSRVCDPLSGLRYVVLIIAYVVGFRTVAGVVLRDL